MINKHMTSRRLEIPDAPDIVHACYESNYNEVARLLNDGADINSVDPRDNLSCLHIACMQNDEALVDVLLVHNRLDNKLNFEAKSSYRPRMAWQYAMNAGFYELGHKVFVAGQEAARKSAPGQPTP